MMGVFSVAAIVLASTVAAHTRVHSVWVNNVDQGDGRNTYIRSPTENSPVKDLASSAMICNLNGAKAAPRFVTAAVGDKISIEWYHNRRQDDIIAASHKGPINVYIATYFEGAGTGPIWTKISEDGYDNTAKKWAVDKLITNQGKYDFMIPTSIKAGKYMIRSEIIALHESDTAYNVNASRGAQFFPSCIQFEIAGSGSAVPDGEFDLNIGYTYSDPGIVFNLYSTYNHYY